MRPLDLSGRVFGRLTVLEKLPEKTQSKAVQWLCSCTCGNTLPVTTSRLNSGNTKSCGCGLIENRIKHGGSYSPEYAVWKNIKERCYLQTNKSYPRYGGRGITMCEEWRDNFEAFLQDVGPRPSSAHSIDRRDNDKDYEPGNCRWATKEEQANNRESNLIYELHGETRTLAEWCKHLGINYYRTHCRLYQLGWAFEEAIVPIEYKRITYDGVTHSLQDWCGVLDLQLADVALRLLRGEAFEDIVLS